MNKSKAGNKTGVVLIALAVFLVAINIIYVRLNSATKPVPELAVESNATWVEVYSLSVPDSTQAGVHELDMILLSSFAGGYNYTTAPPIALKDIRLALTHASATQNFTYNQLNITYLRIISGHQTGFLRPGEVALAQIKSTDGFTPGSVFIEVKAGDTLRTVVNFTIPASLPSGGMMIWPQ